MAKYAILYRNEGVLRALPAPGEAPGIAQFDTLFEAEEYVSSDSAEPPIRSFEHVIIDVDALDWEEPVS